MNTESCVYSLYSDSSDSHIFQNDNDILEQTCTSIKRESFRCGYLAEQSIIVTHARQNCSKNTLKYFPLNRNLAARKPYSFPSSSPKQISQKLGCRVTNPSESLKLTAISTHLQRPRVIICNVTGGLNLTGNPNPFQTKVFTHRVTSARR